MIPITSKDQILSMLQNHEQMSLITDILEGKITCGPKPDAMDTTEETVVS